MLTEYDCLASKKVGGRWREVGGGHGEKNWMVAKFWVFSYSPIISASVEWGAVPFRDPALPGERGPVQSSWGAGIRQGSHPGSTCSHSVAVLARLKPSTWAERRRRTRSPGGGGSLQPSIGDGWVSGTAPCTEWAPRQFFT